MMKFKLTVVQLLVAGLLSAQTPNRFDVVITEIMADPSPVVGLPNLEFIELKNVSARAVNLTGWSLGDGTGVATIGSNFILQPDSQVIICSNAASALFTTIGTAIGISNFPSLDNEGETIFLRSKEGVLIHATAYTKDWYQSAVKSEGGWSLEMRDTRLACRGADNWRASIDPKGGTPGRKNSIDGLSKDDQPPVLRYAYATDSVTMIAVFDEPLDSIKAANASYYGINEGIGKSFQAKPIGPLFDKVQLRFITGIQKNKIYELEVLNISDCAGNNIGAFNKTKTGWASIPDSMDIVINEILFNPPPDLCDYVELYNRSTKIIDLKDCYITNRNSNGTVGQIKQLSATTRLLFPGDYIVVTEDAGMIQRHYLAKNSDAFAIISTLPSFPDDKGAVLLFNFKGAILDELNYDEDWHFKLLNNKEGVSLERINHNNATQNAGNWHSAAASVNYGTPTYQNSQFNTLEQVNGAIAVSPPVFSPDNDGRDDVATLNYEFSEQGYVCNAIIFDANGRVVKNLVRSALCGTKGYFRWDGLDEKNQPLPIGVYIVFTEVFTLKGKVKKFKQAITLARTF
jgi:Lamin Tail Domain